MFPKIVRLLHIIIITSASSGMCADIPYVFGDDGGKALEDSSLYLISESDQEDLPLSPLEPASIELPSEYESTIPSYSEYDDSEVPLLADYDDSDVIVFTTASGPGSSNSENKSRTVGAIKNEINDRVDVDNTITRNAAVVIAAKYPGEYNIDQIASIYDYLKNGWHYVNDPRGIDYYSSASNTLEVGKELECVGAGDCDDFAILMSALVESIGGTTRIILAYNKNSGHAYTEVYLGQSDNRDHQVEAVINWLKSEYSTDEIYTHIDPSTKDVWLNLDWSADNPGGPFYRADRHKPILIRENYNKVAPKLPEGFVAPTATLNSASSGTIKGRVIGEDGEPLITKVVLTDEYGNHQLAVTDRDGNYELILDPGDYYLTAEKTGYYFEEISVRVRSGRETEVPIRGEEEYVIGTGITLGEAYAWSDDESLSNYYK